MGFYSIIGFILSNSTLQMFHAENLDTRINGRPQYSALCNKKGGIMLPVCIAQSIMGGVVPKHFPPIWKQEK